MQVLALQQNKAVQEEIALLDRGAATTRRLPWRRWPDVLVCAGACVIDQFLWGGDSRLRFGPMLPGWIVTVVAIALFAFLLMRFRWPWLLLIVACAHSLAGNFLLQTYDPVLAPLVAIYPFSRYVSLRRAVPAIVCVAAVLAISTASNIVFNDEDLGGSLFVIGLFLVLFVIGWSMGRSGYRADQLAAAREAEHRALAALARQDERLRLARELHDSVAGDVTAALLLAAGARRSSDVADPSLNDALAGIETAGTRALRELRRLLGLLQTEDVDHGAALASGQSLANLPELLEQANRTGLRVGFSELGEAWPLEPESDHVAYRIVQEAISNAVKYAGRGAEVSVRLEWADALRIEVCSAGGEPGGTEPGVISGTEPGVISGGTGLRGLADRAAALGGTLRAGPTPDGTFVVHVSLPRTSGFSYRRSDG